MNKEWATHSLNVRKSTKERLDKFGKMTYDEIIVLLINFWDDQHAKDKD